VGKGEASMGAGLAVVKGRFTGVLFGAPQRYQRISHPAVQTTALQRGHALIGDLAHNLVAEL
jgi:hypothetical protein